MGVRRLGRGGRCVLAAMMVVGLACCAGCERSAAQQMAAPPPPVVTVAHPVWREVAELDEYTGRLEAAAAVDVRARVSGFIDSAPFEEGSVVKVGTLLFVIDPRPFQAEVDKAAADVDRAKAQVELTSSELKRLEKLSGGSATEKEILDARYNKAAADAMLASARAELESANLNLQFTRVTAPIAGRISRKLVTEGNLITGGGTAGPATLLTTITSLDPIYCYVDADERAVLKYQRLSREKKRKSAREARIPAYLALVDEPTFSHEGYIDFVDNRLDPATGTLKARASFRNTDGYFTPGLFARLRVPGSTPYPATLVADEAVGTDQAQRFVLVANKDNVVEYRPVNVGVLFEGMRVVEGVRTDEWVIVNGMVKSRPGMKVEPKQGPMPSRQPVTRPASQPTTEPSPAATEPVAGAGGWQ